MECTKRYRSLTKKLNTSFYSVNAFHYHQIIKNHEYNNPYEKNVLMSEDYFNMAEDNRKEYLTVAIRRFNTRKAIDKMYVPYKKRRLTLKMYNGKSTTLISAYSYTETHTRNMLKILFFRPTLRNLKQQY